MQIKPENRSLSKPQKLTLNRCTNQTAVSTPKPNQTKPNPNQHPIAHPHQTPNQTLKHTPNSKPHPTPDLRWASNLTLTSTHSRPVLCSSHVATPEPLPARFCVWTRFPSVSHTHHCTEEQNLCGEHRAQQRKSNTFTNAASPPRSEVPKISKWSQCVKQMLVSRDWLQLEFIHSEGVSKRMRANQNVTAKLKN